MKPGDQPAFPALPITRQSNGELIYQSAGLTMRDYFAAKAMQGLIVDVERPIYGYIAKTSYEMADAMLKAREQ